MSQSNLERYEQTWSYTELMKNHSLGEIGIWEIRGEDPNCDFGGSHHMPYLMTVEGKLADVIRNVVDLPSFWTWGGGGSINLVKIIPIENLSKTAHLMREKEKLEHRIKEINKELKK